MSPKDAVGMANSVDPDQTESELFNGDTSERQSFTRTRETSP